MSIDRRSILKMMPVSAGGAFAGAIPPLDSAPKLHTELPRVPCRPLDEIKLRGASTGTIVVEDGAGDVCVQRAARDPFLCKVGGSLGVHHASLQDAQGKTLSSVSFDVDCKTEVRDEGGVFGRLLTDVLWTMMDWNQGAPTNAIRYHDRVYQVFVNWIVDHTHFC